MGTVKDKGYKPKPENIKKLKTFLKKVTNGYTNKY